MRKSTYGCKHCGAIFGVKTDSNCRKYICPECGSEDITIIKEEKQMTNAEKLAEMTTCWDVEEAQKAINLMTEEVKENRSSRISPEEAEKMVAGTK